MSYNGVYDDIEDFLNCARPHHYEQYRQPEPIAEPNESFYVHIKDATAQYFPACLLSFRRRFDAKSREQKYQRAINRRHEILRERVDRLTERLAKVAKQTADCLAKRDNALLALRRHIVKDMQDHVKRREHCTARRVIKLKRHNEQVQRCCQLLRYGLYLTRIAKQYEQNRRKRIGIF
ncbi:hypothetical protein AWZ03_002535 [Drosophila navojoa]|uniref:Uncharacterized protein n=1 Tax=Drosophila navojoa TaxID=7232 RepID=A0A484BS15_DRONA|nr:uncharacterized protein LOC108658703 [Drosophila navojoa]TDG50880.1 hypothetical protein AWZ03_002535 [Drosophila navojoa]